MLKHSNLTAEQQARLAKQTERVRAIEAKMRAAQVAKSREALQARRQQGTKTQWTASSLGYYLLVLGEEALDVLPAAVVSTNTVPALAVSWVLLRRSLAAQLRRWIPSSALRRSGTRQSHPPQELSGNSRPARCTAPSTHPVDLENPSVPSQESTQPTEEQELK